MSAPAIRIVAHRGDSAHAPENTLPALAAAVRAKADAVEFDVRLSRDGIPVVGHDANLMRFGGSRKAVAQQTAKELAAADVGTWLHRRFAGVGLPSLDQWLQTAPKKIKLCLELKPTRSDCECLVRTTVRMLQRHRAIERTALLCFQANPLRLAHRLEPRLRLVRNVEPVPRHITRWLRGQPPLIAVDADINRLTPAQADRLRESGVEVWCWTCTTSAHVRQAVACGCTAIIANDPTWARRLVAKAYA
ncbi:MAG: glycerophosphodiester phosphodiesterase family protein [Planctomycetota bacterium]